MSVLIHPQSELIREPRLLVPGQQPLGPVRVDWSHSIGKNVLYSFLGRAGLQELVKNRQATVSGVVTLAGGLYFDSTNDSASYSFTLSAVADLTIVFDIDWPAYANDDDLLFELTANGVLNAGGFLLDPNSGAPTSGKFQVSLYSSPATRLFSFTRPSVGRHRFAFWMSKIANSVRVFIDGVEQAVTDGGGTALSGTFANANGFFCCRNAASLFGRATLYSASFLSGLTADQANDLSRDPYQFLIPA
jgi:hypothetical protein